MMHVAKKWTTFASIVVAATSVLLSGPAGAEVQYGGYELSTPPPSDDPGWVKQQLYYGETEFTPVADPAACSARRAQPLVGVSNGTTIAYLTSGPCTPDRLSGSVFCYDGVQIYSYNFMLFLKYAYSTYYIQSCTPSAQIAECFVTQALVGAPALTFGADVGFPGGCGATSIPSAGTIGGAPAAIVGDGLVYSGGEIFYRVAPLFSITTVP